MPTLTQAVWGSLTVAATLSPAQIEEKVNQLLAEMSLTDKIGQMSGDSPFYSGLVKMLVAYNTEPLPAGENPALGLPGIRFSDGPRGVVMYNATCFPVPMARGATWDVDLEERVGDAIGVEARALGANFFGGVCINLLRHPAWGRAQETFGEDSHHVGEMGAALVRGVQRHVMACVKHFAANSIENSRMQLDVRLDERTLREVYLPHFRRCVGEGVAAVMSAYNKVNGEYCGHNGTLLREILKEEWGFEGFVISDFLLGIRDGQTAVKGGLDIEMPFTWRYGDKLEVLVGSGDVPEALIDDAVRRILRQKIRFAQVGEPGRYGMNEVVSDKHRALAREVAQKSMVLLKNESVGDAAAPLLPLKAGTIRQAAIFGRLANGDNTGDHGSSKVRPPQVVTPLQALWEELRGAKVVHDEGKELETAVSLAQESDIAIVVVGYSHRDEGERILFRGGDRDSLRLSDKDEALITAVSDANPRTVVVMIGGSAIITEAWRDNVPALLMGWYMGMEGGNALTDVLFGEVNPSGKLPCVFPKSEEQLPYFDKNAHSIRYRYYHGYRLLEKGNQDSAFPFGFGLSYTQYQYANLRLSRKKLPSEGKMTVSLEVTNSGEVAGEEVVQLYAGCVGETEIDRSVKTLLGFAKVALASGETKRVRIPLKAEQLAFYDEASKSWQVEPNQYAVFVGPSSETAVCLTDKFQIV